MPIKWLDKLGTIGLIKDAPGHALPDEAWTDGINVRFRESQAENVSGYISMADYSAYLDDMRYIISSWAGAEKWWTIPGQLSGTEKLYAFRLEGEIRDVTPAAGFTINGTDDQFSGGDFDGIPVFTNSQGATYGDVFYVPDISGSGVGTELEYVSGTPLSDKLQFRVVRPWRQHLFGLGVRVVDAAGVDGLAQGIYPQLVWFSDIASPGAVPGSWDADDPATAARYYPDPFASSYGALTDMAALGPYAVVYQESSAHRATYTGQAPFFVIFDTIFTEIGCLAPNCVVPVRGQHAVLTESDFVMHNGTAAESLIEAKMRRWLFSNMDITHFRNTFVAPNHEASELWVCFPETGQTYPNLALIYNYKHNTIGVRELATNTTCGAWGKQTSKAGANIFSPAEHSLFTATQSGNFYKMEHQNGFDGAPPTCTMIKQDIMVDDTSRAVKFVKGIWLDCEASENIDVYVGEHTRPDDEPTWYGPFTFTAGLEDYIPVEATGRLHSIKLTWSNCAIVRLNRIGLDWEFVGQF